MKRFLYLVSLLAFFACQNNEKAAKEELQKAQTLYENHEYSGSKQVLDSLKVKYPKEFPVLKEGQFLRKEIELAEQNRNLMFCDSLLKIKTIEVEPLKKDFIFEKDPEYEDIGKYIYKTQRIENNVQKSYLRSGVNELGEMFISSIYYGGKPIKHTALKVSVKNGEYAETESIAPDGSNNYSFTDGGMTTETVTYINGKDNGVILFIYNQAKEPIKVSYLGEKEVSITLSENDKAAIVKTYDLSSTLLEIERLKKEIRIAEAKIAYLKEKMETQTTEK